MRRLLFWTGAVAALVLGLSSARSEETAALAKVTHVKGDVAAKASQGEFKPLKVGDALGEGMVVQTGKKSRTEIRLADDSVIRLGSKSSLTLEKALIADSKKQVSAKLWGGQAYAVVKKLAGDESSFEVRTGTAVAGVRGTAFRINALTDSSTVVRVYTGAVAVSNAPIYAKPTKSGDKPAEGSFQMPRQGVKPGGPGRVEVAGPQEVTRKEWEEFVAQAMQEVRVSAKGEVSPPVAFDPKKEEAEDEWVAWNKEMDKQLPP